MSMVDSRNFSLPQQHVTRKPLPPQPGASQNARPQPNIQPDQLYLPQHTVQQQQRQPQQQQQQQNPQVAVQPDQQHAHSRSRTASSSVFPIMTSHQPPAQQIPQNTNQGQPQTRMNQYAPPASRRTLSNATTTSTSSTSNNDRMPQRQNSGASSDLQRSTSATSTTSSNSPTSYVAMMRKQKATVWSDRAQHEDPRMVAAQRLAKQRAQREVTGAAAGSRVSTSGSSYITGGVRSKIRHHGAPKAQQYAPGALPASGVPVRLSQNEIDEDDDDEDGQAGQQPFHRRTDSGRSSLGSAGRVANIYASQGAGAAPQFGVSTGSTPPTGSFNRQSPSEYQPVESTSAEETPMPGRSEAPDYFAQKEIKPAQLKREGSGGSGSTDREDSFGQVGKLPQRVKPAEETLDAAELRRRGSVDERTMTMSGFGKLFVANPDVDD